MNSQKTTTPSSPRRRGQYILGGSHLLQVGDRFENIAHLFGPDGSIFKHAKTHIFPAEANWSTSEGDKMEICQLPFAKIGVNICYEAEIPECSASLTEQGAEIILCPSDSAEALDDVAGFEKGLGLCHGTTNLRSTHRPGRPPGSIGRCSGS